MSSSLKRAFGSLWRRVSSRHLWGGVAAEMEASRRELRISTAFARAAATAAARNVAQEDPRTWEFSGFSQHGEDGVVDYLCARLLEGNRYFFEVGSADGLENGTAWLALARSYGGVMIEGDPKLAEEARQVFHGRVWNVQTVPAFVDRENIGALLKLCPYRDPDLLVIDIDGIDYHVGSRILELGYRPKIAMVEYNSAFGPERAVTVPYAGHFQRWEAHPSGLYYGASLAAWRKLLAAHGYIFLTVEQTGCNAFFVQPAAFSAGFLANVNGLAFRDNLCDANAATRPAPDAQGDPALDPRDWRRQWPLISHLPLQEV